MKPPRDDRLIADLQALRPPPRPQFAAELDERAAAGFPRRSRLPQLSFHRPKGMSKHRVLMPVGGVAIALVAVATALVVANQGGSTSDRLAIDGSRPKAPTGNSYFDGSGGYLKPSAEGESLPDGASSAKARANGKAEIVPFSKDFNSSFSFNRRRVERSAEIILAAAPEDVADDSSKVFEAVHANSGIVMRSSTQEGRAGEAGASFELLVPSNKLSDTMAAFSQIDHVHSRHEATADITAPTVSTAELLKESRARIDGLLAQLGSAESDEETETIEAELRHQRRHAGRLAAQLDHLHRRADFSRVSLRIETGGRGESTGAGGWGIDDALHDAGHVLTIAAAVTLVGLAVLAPVALIALLAWLTHRAWVRRERRRALG